MTKAVALDRLREISKQRAIRRTGAVQAAPDLRHHDQRPAVEWPIEVDTRSVR
jgi:hypothetical protein